MPELKPGTIMPTPEEDAAIDAAAAADPDSHVMTDGEWEIATQTVRIGRPDTQSAKD